MRPDVRVLDLFNAPGPNWRSLLLSGCPGNFLMHPFLSELIMRLKDKKKEFRLERPGMVHSMEVSSLLFLGLCLMKVRTGNPL